MDFKPELFINNKNYVISASAGTGKTYNIIGIITRLVKDYKVDLKKILVVTYTDKACGELKNRIRKELGDKYDVSHAPIFTIHSFSEFIIRKYGISSLMPLNMSIIDDSYLDRFIDNYIRENEPLKELVNIIVLNGKFKEDDIKRHLKLALSKYYLNFNYDEDDKVVTLDVPTDSLNTYNTYLNVLKSRSIIDLENLGEKMFVANYNTLSKSSNKRANDFIKDLDDNLKLGSLDFSGKNFQARFDWGSDENKEAFIYFKNLKDSISNLSIPTIITIKYLKDLYIKWQDYKLVNKYQTFDDMIRNLLEAIKNPNVDLLNKLREDYQYGIIDEFQDTNQKQFDIFSKIFLSPDHNLIVVGDKKQSIYSFQGADVKVYESALDIIKNNNDGKDETISKNHRSSKSMVESTNSIFKLDEYGFKDFVESKSLEDNDEEKFEAIYDGKLSKAIYINKENKINNKEVDEYEFARLAVSQILDFITLDKNGNTKLRIKSKKEGERNITFKDIAVLARTRSEMTPIVKTFESIGIPYIKYKDTSLYSSNECYHFIVLLEAIASVDFTGKNRNLFKKALFTDFYSKSLNEIKDDKYNKDESSEMIQILKYKDLLKDGSYEDLIDSIIYKSDLISNLKSLSKMSSLSIYKQIGDYAISYLNQYDSIDLLISNLKGLCSGDLDLEEGDSIVAKSTDFNAVKIMTIHASKGLEFPIVISVAGFKERNNSVPNLFYHRDELGKPKIIFDSSIGKQDEIEELKRLFYVAFTRGKYILILPNYSGFAKNLSFLSSSISKFITTNNFVDISNLKFNRFEFSNLVKNVLSNDKDNNKKGDDDTIKELEDNNKLLINTLPKISTYKHSYSSLSHDEDDDKDDMLFEEDDIEKERENHVDISDIDLVNIISVPGIYNTNIVNKDLSILPKGKYSGNALHEIFELFDFTKNPNEIDNKFIMQIFNKQYIKFSSEEPYDLIRGIVGDTLNAKLPEITGNKITGNYFSLNQISSENKKAEIEFNFNMINKKLSNYCNGFMDLVIKRGEIYSILDWKTDSLNDDFKSYVDLNELKLQVDRRYSIQRVLYSYTLINWLSSLLNKSKEEVFNNNFGGIYYVFLRGTAKDSSNGVYAHSWKSYDDLESAYKGILSINNIKEN